MCLEFFCTSTQSSNLEWVIGGGINSPRHQTSRWLKAAEKGTVGWFDATLFQGVGSSGAPPTSRSRWGSLTQLLRRYAPTLRRIIRCWRPRVQVATVSFKLTVGWTDANPDQGVGSSGAEGFVLARFCMNSNWASDRPTGSPLRLSDHLVLLSSLLFLCNSSDTTK
jgi:hypothetical protein